MDRDETRLKIAEAISTCGVPSGMPFTEEEIEQAFNGWIRMLESLKDEIKKNPEMFVMHFSQLRDIIPNETKGWSQIGPLVTELVICDWRKDQEEI